MDMMKGHNLSVYTILSVSTQVFDLYDRQKFSRYNYEWFVDKYGFNMIESLYNMVDGCEKFVNREDKGIKFVKKVPTKQYFCGCLPDFRFK